MMVCSTVEEFHEQSSTRRVHPNIDIYSENGNVHYLLNGQPRYEICKIDDGEIVCNRVIQG